MKHLGLGIHEYDLLFSPEPEVKKVPIVYWVRAELDWIGKGIWKRCLPPKEG